MSITGQTYTAPPPTLAAFLVGDAIGFVPKPWPRAKFKEALADTLHVFGDPWMICECKEPPTLHQETADEQSWLAVTKMSMEVRNEFNEMRNSRHKSEPCKACKEMKKESIVDVMSEKWENAKKEDDHNTFCLIGITEEEKMPEVLSEKRVLPDRFQQILQEVKKKKCETVHDTMLYLEEELSQTMTTSLKLNDNVGKEFKMKIPTIVVVVEGDLDTINHVARAVQKNIPVLLVRGSGMAADLIGYCS
ncbi:uncharacterized protein LOC110444540, partial [Mizuhopecten yessoensis]|uniref:uncharacterized protein LOC110444540 n=1 Tax=Mizuhopecten yessoensis TaxID=6573 RepID=UPI000B45ADC9